MADIKKMADKIRAEIFFSGKVQGVFFRDNIKNKADFLGVSGWAKNLPDGRVEAVFEGEQKDVKYLAEWIESDSGLAEIGKIEVKFGKFTGELESFKIF